MRGPVRLPLAAVGVLGLSLCAVTVAAAPAQAADTDVRINEVRSSSPTDEPDFVELTNVGQEPVTITGWVLRDNDDTHALVLPEATIDPGAFLVIEPDETPDGFGLGGNDEARLFLPDGETLIDSYAWTDHAVSEGRIPDGTGAFTDTESTPAEPNVARTVANAVVINEVESNGDPLGDWVELANTNLEQTADITGWTLVDGDPTHEPIVLAGEIESGGYRAILTEPHFGLGGEDSVTVRDATGALVGTVSWSTHAAATIGRCPDMTGDLTETSEGTFELVNACEDVTDPEVVAEPWPFGNDVHDGVAPGTWGEDMSGLDVAADGTIYAVNNDNAEIFELDGSGNLYTIAQAWLPTYPDGTGQPDAEGLSVAGDGAIFLSTERDNTASGTSRPSVLRVELGDAGATTTTHEWNLAAITGALGANAGLEGIEWISDADATRLGVLDADGAPYDPAAFSEHFGGIFAVSVEQTGAVHLVVLTADGGTTLLQTAQTSASVPVLMDLDWRAGGNELWGLCDEACQNRTSVFAFDGGLLTWQVDHHAPTGMNTSFTNEGLSFLWCADDPSAAPTTLWISDTAHDGVSLRVAAGDACGGTDPTDPEPTDPGTSDPGTPDPEPTDPGTSEPTEPSAPSEDDLTDDTRGGLTGPATAEPGDTVTYTLPGAAGERVHVWLLSEPVLLTTVTVGADDTFEVTIPTDAAVGQHRVVVQDADGTVLGWVEIEILPDGTAVVVGSDGLADTGVAAGVTGLALAAAAAVLLGGALLAVRRRALLARA